MRLHGVPRTQDGSRSGTEVAHSGSSTRTFPNTLTNSMITHYPDNGKQRQNRCLWSVGGLRRVALVHCALRFARVCVFAEKLLESTLQRVFEDTPKRELQRFFHNRGTKANFVFSGFLSATTARAVGRQMAFGTSGRGLVYPEGPRHEP